MSALPALAVLGAGSMAGAIVTGLLESGLPLDGEVVLTNRSRTAAERWAGVAGVRALATEELAEANQLAVAGAGLVLVAVKPLMVPDVLAEIAPKLAPGTVVVSVAAGVTTATMEALLPETVAVVRTMPNTPTAVRRGVTGVAAGARASDADLAVVETLFSTIGSVLRVDERQIDALSTISGSGPAYVFYLIEQLEAAALALGFDAAQAALMVRDTFAGSLELLAASGQEPAELRRRVTSPNGTTERAIAAFDAAGLPQAFREAPNAALARARELASGA